MKYALIIMKGLRKLRARNLKESGKRKMKASLKTSERLPKLLVCFFVSRSFTIPYLWSLFLNKTKYFML